MKSKLVIAIFLSTFLLIVPSVKAANFIDYQTVDTNKTWTIKFTEEISLDDLTKQGITVTDSEGNVVNVGIWLGTNDKGLMVTAPQNGYAVGKSYILNIGTKVHSVNGKKLNTESKIHFNIGNDDTNNVVTFKDKNLEQEIRNAISKPSGDILKSDVEKITSFKSESKNIKDISGIETLTNLKKLDLSDNPIINYNALKGLTNLQELGLCDNQILDVGFLKDLTNLQTLYLQRNQIRDISALKYLIKLQDIVLEENKINDISALKGLINLQFLDLYENQINNIGALKELTNLQYINLSNNQINDISVLKYLTKLNCIDLSNNKINNISALKGLSSLKQIDLKNNQISDISALKDLTDLLTLDLSKNKIDDISALKKLTNLKFLDLSDNQMSDNDIKELKISIPGFYY